MSTTTRTLQHRLPLAELEGRQPCRNPPIEELGRWAITGLLLAGLLILAHGCHRHGDEDNELFARQLEKIGKAP